MRTRNVTVSLEEEVALWARLEAARRDTSVSRLLGDVLKQQMAREKRYEKAMRSALARAPFLTTDGRYLSRDEVYLSQGQVLDGVRVVSPFEASPGSLDDPG